MFNIVKSQIFGWLDITNLANNNRLSDVSRHKSIVAWYIWQVAPKKAKHCPYQYYYGRAQKSVFPLTVMHAAANDFLSTIRTK